MTQLDRTTARALVEAGEMPVAQYIEMFEPQMMLHVAPQSIAADGKRRELERFLSTTFILK
jgi:hypothetical protein